MRPAGAAILLAGSLGWLAAPAQAAPASVTAAGSFQSELGCPGDWQPDCALTHLAYDAVDEVWQASFALPAGSYEYKAAIDDSWTVSYPAVQIPLSLAAPAAVKVYYDDETNWVVDDAGGVIAVAAGSFQSELGCPGDWQPDCLRSWLQDPDGDGTYGFTTQALPAGDYEAKVAHDEAWDESYGAGGAPGGANIPFSVPANGTRMSFAYDPASHLLTIVVPEPSRAALLAGVLAVVAARAGSSGTRSRAERPRADSERRRRSCS